MATTEPEARREFSVAVVSTLRRAGFVAYWAGGCVRDLILGEEPSDFDVATDARPDQVMGLFRRTVPVGVSFGVVRVLGDRRSGEVEVATFRSDGAYLDGRRPESVAFSDPESDAARRDFTINGMFLDPLGGEVIDFVGGRADLDARVIRAIGDPAGRFDEDKLRLLRAARFAARFGFEIEAKTRSSLEALAPTIRVVAAERIGQELRKMLVHPSKGRGMALAMDLGLLDAILPDVARLKGRSVEGGADAWGRTLDVLEALPDGSPFEVGFAALLHLTGTDEAGSSVDAADRAGRALKLANAERALAMKLAESPSPLVDPRGLSVPQLKRRLARPEVAHRLALDRAIARAAGTPPDAVDFCEGYLRDLPDGSIQPPSLINGNDLLDAGVPPGPSMRTLLDEAYDAQLANEVSTRDGALAWVARRRGASPGGNAGADPASP